MSTERTEPARPVSRCAEIGWLDGDVPPEQAAANVAALLDDFEACAGPFVKGDYTPAHVTALLAEHPHLACGVALDLVSDSSHEFNARYARVPHRPMAPEAVPALAVFARRLVEEGGELEANVCHTPGFMRENRLPAYLAAVERRRALLVRTINARSPGTCDAGRGATATAQ
jgi:hypothetical protein